MRATLDELGPRRRLDTRPDPARPLVLEVGCGLGDAAVAFARHRPEVDLLALDVHTPGVARVLAEAERLELANLFVERADAIEVLHDRIATGGLTGVHVFFPDPWPKTRHHKRRFVRPDVLDLLADRLAPGARLLVATDVVDYARWAERHLDAHPDFVGGRADRPSWRPAAGYEAKGRAAGRDPVDLAYRRR